VEDAALVLVEAHAGLEQLLVERAAGVEREPRVGEAGQQMRTSTPRATAALSAMIVSGSGTKYAIDTWMLFSA
jgi:hypothetical protein